MYYLKYKTPWCWLLYAWSSASELEAVVHNEELSFNLSTCSRFCFDISFNTEKHVCMFNETTIIKFHYNFILLLLQYTLVSIIKSINIHMTNLPPGIRPSSNTNLTLNETQAFWALAWATHLKGLNSWKFLTEDISYTVQFYKSNLSWQTSEQTAKYLQEGEPYVFLVHMKEGLCKGKYKTKKYLVKVMRNAIKIWLHLRK